MRLADLSRLADQLEGVTERTRDGKPSRLELPSADHRVLDGILGPETLCQTHDDRRRPQRRAGRL
jgi:hypothetical protein